MVKRNKRVAIYARVSTDKQTAQNQLIKLREYARLREWELVEEYVDKGISGAKGRTDRKKYQAMIDDARKRRFDVLLCFRLDRLSRSLHELLNLSQELHAWGVDLSVFDQQIDTTTPHGRLYFQIVGAFAEFERGMLTERVKAGLERARKHGTRSGAPIGRPTAVTDKVRAKVLQMRAKGIGLVKIGRTLGIGTGSVQRVILEGA